MNRIAPIQKKSLEPHLVGLGLDCDDGHTRITQGEEFSIVGGSEETHGCMTETVCKTFEDLKNEGRTLANVEQEHLQELLHNNLPD
mgnify:CR=1 FL=1